MVDITNELVKKEKKTSVESLQIETKLVPTEIYLPNDRASVFVRHIVEPGQLLASNLSYYLKKQEVVIPQKTSLGTNTSCWELLKTHNKDFIEIQSNIESLFGSLNPAVLDKIAKNLIKSVITNHQVKK